MARMILAIAGEWHDTDGGGWRVRRYAYLDEHIDGDRVKDENYAMRLVMELGIGESSWIVNEKPPASMRRFFDIELSIENHGKANARYSVERHAYPGCPQIVVSDGMDIERSIRKFGTNPANAQERRKRKARKDDKMRKLAAMGLGC